MKRVTPILLVLLFLITNSGIAVTVHYCGGKLASVDIFSNGNHKCKCGNKPMKPNCCKDKTTVFKSNTDLAKTNHFTFKLTTQKDIYNVVQQIESDNLISFNFATSDYYRPPFYKLRVPIYLLNGVFLI